MIAGESLRLAFDNEARYREVLAEALPESGDLEIITLRSATQAGNTGVMLTFTVKLPNGSMQRVQAVTTMKLFTNAARAILHAEQYNQP